MLNFDLYNPTQICFGKGRIGELDTLISPHARVLVLYGGSSAERTGTLSEVKDALAGRTVMLFGGIEANPTYETLMKAVEFVRENRVDFLLAVGGGSVIDGTKFVAAAAVFDGEPWDILLKRGSNVEDAIPFGSVLTLPATGSEMNSGSVITRKEHHAKLFFGNKLVFPKFSILDPTKTFTLPERQVANGVVDSFVHVVEQYLTYPVNAAVQDRFSESLLQTLIDLGPKALDREPDLDNRANLMWVATLALNGLIGAGVPHDWATHMIGHELTALYGIDHARTLAVILPSMLEVRKESKSGKLLQYAERVWNITSGDDDEKIQEAIDKTRDFFERMGVNTRLADYGVGIEQVPAILKQLEEHKMTSLGETQDVDIAMSQKIIERSL